MSETPGFRKAMLLLTGSSLLVPVVGIATAPILSHALGVEGRGVVAAAMAPNALIVVVATLGLPEAITYHVAKRPDITRRALGVGALITTVLGFLSFLATLLFSGFLSNGDTSLAQLILLAAALAIPMLGVNLLRAAAFGRQMWTEVALERTINSVLRLGALAVLALMGDLDTLAAVIVISVTPIVGGVMYWRLLFPAPAPLDPAAFAVTRNIVGYGSQVWIGAIAGMLSAKLGQLFILPLSTASQLGLFVIAVTVADVPFIIASAVREVIFGLDSKERNAQRLALTTRMATLICLLGSAVLGVTLPLWIAPVFGAGFDAAVVPTWILLAATVVNIPAVMASTGLSAWGKPALRSVSFVIALAGNFLGIVLFVPTLGALGGAIAALISAVGTAVFCILLARRIVGVPARRFLIPERDDFVLLGREAGRVLGRFRRGRGASDGETSPEP